MLQFVPIDRFTGELLRERFEEFHVPVIPTEVEESLTISEISRDVSTPLDMTTKASVMPWALFWSALHALAASDLCGRDRESRSQIRRIRRRQKFLLAQSLLEWKRPARCRR